MHISKATLLPPDPTLYIFLTTKSLALTPYLSHFCKGRKWGVQCCKSQDSIWTFNSLGSEKRKQTKIIKLTMIAAHAYHSNLHPFDIVFVPLLCISYDFTAVFLYLSIPVFNRLCTLRFPPLSSKPQKRKREKKTKKNGQFLKTA